MSAPRILLIPGLDDIHWVMLKMQDLIAKSGMSKPEIWIWNFDGRPRSLDFVKRIPFVTAGGYWDEPMDKHQKIFNSAYLTGDIDQLTPFREFDHFICFNGSLRVGRDIERDILPGITCDWDYPIARTETEDILARRISAQAGRYVLLYFSDHGMFRTWLRHWTPRKIREFIQHARELLPDRRFLLTGSTWDAPFNQTVCNLPGLMNLVGKTSFDELVGLVRRADAFAGWCGGNTMLSAHLRIPTLMLWSDYFKDSRFQRNWIDRSRLGSTYVPISVERKTPREAAEILARMISDNEQRRAAA